MSLKGMHYDNPEVGGSDQGMYWGGYNSNINSLPDLTEVLLSVALQFQLMTIHILALKQIIVVVSVI
jgi:hypothetical protein